MAVSVSFNGSTYSVPTTAGESGWATTLSAYLQALASGAATTSTVKQAIRTAIASPVTVVAATDYTVVTNLTVPGAVAVNLPAGVAKQVFVIVDGKGDAATNNVTIDANASQTINGALTYVINENFGGVMLQFDGTSWVVLAAFYGSDPSFTSLTVTTLGVTGTATVGTLTATSGTVGGAAITTLSNTQTFTNKTFDADGTGNSITNIENADIKAAAAIARSKLATGTVGHVVINDPSTGAFSSEAQLAVTRGGTGVSTSTGSGANVLATSPTLVTPALGTPSAAVLTNATGLPIVGGTTGTLTVARGGTGLTALGTGLQLLRVNAGATALEYASTGSGDVVGPASSVASEVALFDLTTGKLIKRATGTGYVKVSSGVYQTPAATVPIAEVAPLTTGGAPAAGVIGERLFNDNVNTNNAVNNTPFGPSITLTAGVWDLTAKASLAATGTLSGTGALILAVSANSASFTGTVVGTSRLDSYATSAVAGGCVPAVRVSVSSNTAYYAVAQISLTSGTGTLNTTITAVRVG